MCANINDITNKSCTNFDNSDTTTTSTSNTRTRKASFQMNELGQSLPFLPPMITSKRRITSRDWGLSRSINDASALPSDFSFTDASLEDDPNTSALQSFSESERSLFSDSSIFSQNNSVSSPRKDVRRSCNERKVCIPTDLDVLLGRGGLTNNHSGNIRYREEVEKVKPMYFSCLTKSEKKEVSELLVAYVQDYGGRFLEKDSESGEWVIASQSSARKKASQALRETKWKQNKIKKEDKPG